MDGKANKHIYLTTGYLCEEFELGLQEAPLCTSLEMMEVSFITLG